MGCSCGDNNKAVVVDVIAVKKKRANLSKCALELLNIVTSRLSFTTACTARNQSHKQVEKNSRLKNQRLKYPR